MTLKCEAKNKETGLPCRASRFKSSKVLCIFHCPEDLKLRQQMSQKGGFGRFQRPLDLKDFKVKGIADIKTLLEATLTSVGKGDKTIPARDLAHLSKIYLETVEKTDMEKRLRQLESNNSIDNDKG